MGTKHSRNLNQKKFRAKKDVERYHRNILDAGGLSTPRIGTPTIRGMFEKRSKHFGVFIPTEQMSKQEVDDNKFIMKLVRKVIRSDMDAVVTKQEFIDQLCRDGERYWYAIAQLSYAEKLRLNKEIKYCIMGFGRELE